MSTNYIDWNDASKLGLIKEINAKVLHPLGLAMSRNPDTGSSDIILVAPDGVYQYANGVSGIEPPKSNQELMERIEAIGITIKETDT